MPGFYVNRCKNPACNTPFRTAFPEKVYCSQKCKEAARKGSIAASKVDDFTFSEIARRAVTGGL